MRLRSLLSIALGIFLISATVWYVKSHDVSNASPAYVPRSDIHSPAGIAGAMEYYRMIRANVYTGEVEPEDILAMRKAVNNLKNNQSKNANVTWASLGPNNVGGRTRAILSFPNEPNTLIAGGVSGGLFKSTNGGLGWNRLTGFTDELIVSSIAMLGNGSIYVGTGHSREHMGASGGSGFIGGGLFVSNDEGSTWNLVSNFEPTSFSTSEKWANIDKLHNDPSNPDRLWISTNFGFYPYIHGDTELGDLPNGLLTLNASDQAFSSDGEYILIQLGSRAYLSRDYGENFVELGSDVGFAAGNLGATEVVISPDDKNFMVASISTPFLIGGGAGFLKGVYASVDGGLTWHIIAPGSNNGGTISQFAPFYNGSTAQGNYDNMLTVVPHGDGTREVILGGIRMWRWALAGTTPGISAWDAVNLNFSSFPGAPPSPFYVHSDIHTSEWDANGNLYIGSDGGIFKSTDKGESWTDMNRDFLTTQYYAIAFDPQGRVLGGLQDNGSLWLNRDGADPKLAIEVLGGDGFSCEISQFFPNYMFATLYYGSVHRSTDSGNSMTSGSFGNLDSKLTSVNRNDFTTDIALYENSNNDFSEIYIRYIPAIDNPYLVFYDTPVVTSAGDTIIARIPAGTDILVDAANNDFQIPYTPAVDLNFYSYYTRTVAGEEFDFHDIGDTAMVREAPQFMLAAAVSRGVFVTRQPLKTNGVAQFYKVDNGETTSDPTSVEWSPDGDVLYIGYGNGKLVRIKNFNSAWTPEKIDITKSAFVLERTVIHTANGPVMDIDVDYSQGRGGINTPASEKVAIAIGGYGGSGKVMVSETAASAPGFGSFQNVWNVPSDIMGMPVYSIVMDVVNPDILMIGTEYGIWYSDNGGDSWTESNNGDMPRVPVFDLRQQKMEAWRVGNPGVVYAGSHGQGVFQTDYLGIIDGLDDMVDMSKPLISGLKVYPNPVSGDMAHLEFDLAKNTDVSYRIYSITGKLMTTEGNRRVVAGKSRNMTLDLSTLPAGAYIVQLQAGNVLQTGKFIKSF